MKKFLMAGFLALLALVPAAAQTEKIRSFDSRITVNTDGSMQVVETIAVESAGVDIVHGIYRDFPTRYRDRAGNKYAVLFDIVRLRRDGNMEPYHTEDVGNGVRVYFGSSTYDLPPGPHTYQFTYRTNRQLGFFRDHDELYWNVTGNGWKWPIDVATATVLLPTNVRNLVTGLEGYTGYEGEKGQAYTATRDEESNPTFRTENLASHQGLSIVVTWPKGLIAEPTTEQKRAWFIADNKSIIFGVAGWIVVLLYYVMIWGMVGRDPARGTIVPLYEPPDNMSPAAMRFLERMGFDEKTFTAAIMGLAAKGYLTIQQDESKTYKLARRKNATDQNSDLSADEKSLARTLFEDESTLVLKNKNHELLASARKGVENNLHATIETTSFRTNARYLWPGIILTVLTVVAVVLMTGGSLLPVALFMSVWLTGWSFGVYALVSSVIRAWKSVRTEGVLGAGQAGFLTLFSLPFIAGECVGLGLMIWACGVAAAGIIAAAIGLNILFHHLLKAPTLAGRALMDRVEGFKMFLTAVDADRLQTIARPDKTPQLFERFLPYAFALGVEHAWAQQFSQVLAQAAIAGSGGTSYSPSWYSGAALASFSATDFTSSFGSSFSSAISSSSTAPGSSSGSGGGGSSGGGGGGGGGGGW